MAKRKPPSRTWIDDQTIHNAYYTHYTHYVPRAVISVWADGDSETRFFVDSANLVRMSPEKHDSMEPIHFFAHPSARWVEREEAPPVPASAAKAETVSKARYRPSLVLDMLVPYDRAQDMQANLGEVYPLWVARHGLRRAELICVCQVALLIGGAWWEKLLSTGERLLKVFRILSR